MNKPLKYGLFLVISVATVIFTISTLLALLIKNNNILYILIVAFVSSFIISFLVIISAPLLKDIMATYRTMMRLENLSHPLLLELSLKAPGTYNHSLIVSNLSNRAAKTIGADSILTRIGGYYHDIGKIENPEYFIENQSPGENIHTEINNPKKSAKIIMDHVKNGIKLATKYNLPKDIIDLIEQHHGTTLITFFYEQAKNQHSKVQQNDFKYPGPKPLTAEAAILLFADAIEAKIRLCNKITPLIIRETVDEIINKRINEKQLELCPLNEIKIERIRQSFIDTLSTMYHQRIKYPN